MDIFIYARSAGDDDNVVDDYLNLSDVNVNENFFLMVASAQ